MTTSSSMLLTTADRQIERFTSAGNPAQSLQDSLYEAILFHGTGVLPDIFAFISTPIREAQNFAGATHLESAIEAGLVIPAFRTGCDSFTNSLDRIESQGIQGVQPAVRLTANRFDDCLHKAKNKNFKIWPMDLSRDYGKKFIAGIKLIGGDTHSALPGKLSENLGITAEFIKNRGILEETEAAFIDGELRRGEVYNLLLRALEAETSTGKTSVHDSYADLVQHKACQANRRLEIAVRNLVVLANSVYQFNMADAFNSSNYAPGRLFATDSLPALCVALNCARGVSPKSSHLDEIDSDLFKVEVILPNVEQLRAVGWKELIAIRNDVGAGYFAALKNWEDYPEQFGAALKAYAAALTSRVKVKAPPLTIALKKFAESEREGVAAIARQAVAMATDGAVGEKILGLAGIASSMVLAWRYERAKTLAFAHSPTASIAV